MLTACVDTLDVPIQPCVCVCNGGEGWGCDGERSGGVSVLVLVLWGPFVTCNVLLYSAHYDPYPEVLTACVELDSLIYAYLSNRVYVCVIWVGCVDKIGQGVGWA
jgi:hypothetical protein